MGKIMGFTKEKALKYFTPKLVFIYLILYPLGQLVRIDIIKFNSRITINPIDVVAFISLVLFIFLKPKKPKSYKYITGFLLAAVFSLLFSLSFFPFQRVLVGSLYLIRLFSYIALFALSWNYFKGRTKKKLLIHALIATCMMLAIFGWIQYYFYFDLRFLKTIGWDDHLGRMVSTLLDPGFTGLILVLGALASLGLLYAKRKLIYLFPFIFLFVSTFYTYSRASYLSLFVGILTMLVIWGKKLRVLAGIGFVSLIIVLLLPKPSSSGVQLGRLFSVFARIDNYEQTLTIFTKSPVFGVGYNNICAARMKYIEPSSAGSHSCSGADSSLLLILATMGVVGFMMFLYMCYGLYKNLGNTYYAKIFIASIASVFTNSLFDNSLFYAWTLGWLALLLAISQRHFTESS